MELKMKDDEFLGDISALLRPVEKYNHDIAYQLVRKQVLDRI
jgi:hypothetical protein